jgi:hypothetical protein
MTLGIKADVLDRKKEYERVPVLRNDPDRYAARIDGPDHSFASASAKAAIRLRA